MHLQKYKPNGWVSPPQGWLLALVLAGMGLVAGLLLTGCQSASSTSAPITLQFSTWGSQQEIQIVEKLLDTFESENPDIHVELIHIPESYFQKLHILVAADMTPDVMLVNSLNFPVYATHGIFADLNPYLDRVDEVVLHRNHFYPQGLQSFQWPPSTGANPSQSIQGALPRDLSNLVVYYNTSWFQRTGTPLPTADWTWQGCLERAQNLTTPATDDTPATWGLSFYRAPPLFWMPFVWSWGGKLFSSDFSNYTLDEPAAVEGLQFYADLRHKYHVAPTLSESGQTPMSQLFLQERVAMMVSGRWSVPVLRQQNRFEWDVAPFPKGPDGSRVGIDASGYAMAANSKHPEAAWQLIRFLSSEHGVEAFTEGGLIIPARRDVAESLVFLDPNSAPHNSRVFLTAIEEGVPTHTPPRWNEISETLQLYLDPVWDGRSQAQTATEGIRSSIEKLLPNHGGSARGPQ